MAERIKPEIETKIHAEASTNTIVASLKRLSDNRPPRIERIAQAAYDTKLSLNDSVIDLDFRVDKRNEVMSFFDEIVDTEAILFLIQTSKNFRILTKSTQLYDVTKELLSEQSREPSDKRFSTVTLSFSTGKIKGHLQNLMFEISRFLNNSGIEIHSAFFTPSEIVINLSNADAIKLYEMLQTEFVKNKLDLL
jgi:hypothetical protein